MYEQTQQTVFSSKDGAIPQPFGRQSSCQGTEHKSVEKKATVNREKMNMPIHKYKKKLESAEIKFQDLKKLIRATKPSCRFQYTGNLLYSEKKIYEMWGV